jgi:two-component system, OmpR family, phosphate regulon response regulator PhoB
MMINQTLDNTPTGTKILVAQRDANAFRLIRDTIKGEGYDVIGATNGEEVLSKIPLQLPSVIVLDVMLPIRSGFEVCKQIRSDKRFSHIAILALAATAEEAEIAFDLGVDDHVTKPFTELELTLRIRRLLRTRPSLPTEPEVDEIALDDLHLDIPRHETTVEGRQVHLTSTEFKLLKVLAQRRGRVQTRERLLYDVWDYNRFLATRTVDTHVQRLRRKLGAAQRYLESVRGVGYRFAEI